MANLINKYPVPLMFKKILKDSMSGELAITHDDFTKKLFFLNGQLAFATTTLEYERLGELLFSSGKITGEQLEKLTKIVQNSKRKTGVVLSEITPLTLKEIYAALVSQVKLIASSTFSLNQGSWKFVVKIPEIQDHQKFKIKLPAVITEGVKKIDDVSYYKKRFLHRSPLTETLSGSVEKYLTPEEIAFHEKLAGFSNSPVEEIIPGMELREDLFWKNLLCLYLLNVVDFVEYTGDEKVNKNIEEIRELFEIINSNQFNYYRLFGLEKSASFDEVKDRYFNLSKKYHPDRITADPDSEIKEKANAVFAEINMGYEILSDRDKRREYDAERVKQNPRVGSNGADRTKRAKDLYLKAYALCNQEKYFEAVSLLEEAVEDDNSKASYFLLLGKCLSKSSSPIEKMEAEKHLKKAGEMEPWNPEPLFVLGELYRSRNLMEEAEDSFRKALELETEDDGADDKTKDKGDELSEEKSLFSIFKKKK